MLGCGAYLPKRVLTNEELARMVEDGTIRVMIAGERDFRDATQALEQSKSGSVTGKLVLTVESGRI